MLCLCICVCGACAVRVAGDELLALLAFVVHRVAQSAHHRHQEANERDAEDEDAAREVEVLAFRQKIDFICRQYGSRDMPGATQRTNITRSYCPKAEATQNLCLLSCGVARVVASVLLTLARCSGCFAVQSALVTK